MTQFLCKKGDFKVCRVKGDRRERVSYPTHRLIKGKAVRIPWTKESLLYVQLERQKQLRPELTEGWTIEIEHSNGGHTGGLRG